MKRFWNYLLAGTMILGGLIPVRESLAIEVSEPLDYTENYSFGSYEATGVCGEGVYFEYVDNYVEMQEKLTISGNGEIYDLADFQTNDGYYRSPAPWSYYAWTIQELVIEEGITRIGNSAFTSRYIPYISLPESLTNIGMFAFATNRTLESIVIPSNVKTIEQSVFFDCIMLQEIWIPENLESLGYGVFTNCTSLTDIYFGGTEEQWNQLNPDNIAKVGSTRTFDSDGQAVYAYHDVTIHYSTPIRDSTATEPELVYTPLPTATLYTSYLGAIPNMSESATLVSGALPKGLGIYPDGTIGGIPSQTGTFEFVVNTSAGEEAYSITVEDNTSENVEVDNDHEIIERILEVSRNDQNYIYEVSGEYAQFLNVYLNGTLLIPEVEYLAEEGSTKITILASTMSQLNTGSHTINATFVPVGVKPSTSSSSANVIVEKVAQTFEKTVEKASKPMMPFYDVTEGDWFYEPVLFMYKQGTLTGTSAVTYEPYTKMTRGMMAVTLYALAEKPETGSANFSDVPETWYTSAVNWVSVRGIDDSVGTFRPDEYITREEVAKMMYNFCTDQGVCLPLVTSSSPNDMGSVSGNSQVAVDALYQRGIFSGDENGYFNPKNTASRAEISTIMKNFISVMM